jgi:hypothetical protein
MNTNNFTNILKNSNLFLGIPIGTRKSCLMKKKPDTKNLMTLSLWCKWWIKVRADPVIDPSLVVERKDLMISSLS